MNNAYILLIALTIVLVLYYINNCDYGIFIESSNYIKFKVNKGINYIFMRDSANSLDSINTRINVLIKYLTVNYPDKNITKILVEKYHPGILSEAKIQKNYTTYTVNKKDIKVCLRTRDEKEDLYDANLLMYVVLHELGHFCNYDDNNNPIIGHGEEFKTVFKFLVDAAMKCNVYTFEDYSVSPKEYCGLNLSSQITTRL